MKIRPITLTQFNKEYGNDPVASLYVLNRSNPVGQIAFNCINELNVTIPVLIPSTFIPVDLTQMAPLENLLKSSFFRQVLAKGQLVIVRKDDAEKYLATPRARAELQNISKLVGAFTEADQEEEIDMEDAGNTSSRLGDKKKKKKKKQKQASAHDDFVTAMIDRANDSDESDDALQREFLTHQRSLNMDDLERMRKEVKRPALTEMILEEMEERRNDDEEEEEDDE